jgi:hypothetical protein
MRKEKATKVPVQKGTIISNPPTMKQMPWIDKTIQRYGELSGVRRGQTLEMKTPRRSK